MTKKSDTSSSGGEVKCEHTTKMDDECTGDVICLQCGLVLHRLLDAAYDVTLSVAFDHVSWEREQQFRDVCDANLMNEGLVQIAGRHFRTFRKSEDGAKFADNEIAAYSLYYAALTEGAGRSAAEIAAYFHVACSALCRIEGIFPPPLTTLSPLSFLSRHCPELDIDWRQERKIGALCQRFEDVDGRDPRTVAAASICLHYELMHQASKMSQKRVAKVFNISRSAICSCVRALREELPFL